MGSRYSSHGWAARVALAQFSASPNAAPSGPTTHPTSAASTSHLAHTARYPAALRRQCLIFPIKIPSRIFRNLRLL